jgi:hypothetical protein
MSKRRETTYGLPCEAVLMILLSDQLSIPKKGLLLCDFIAFNHESFCKAATQETTTPVETLCYFFGLGPALQ